MRKISYRPALSYREILLQILGDAGVLSFTALCVIVANTDVRRTKERERNKNI